ncbi:MAG: Methyltransferase type 11, partial [Parcubacteria group bacterium GW2011_GWC2_38_7]
MNEYGEVKGCDISSLALELCGKRKVSVFPADLNLIDLGIERYDVITSIDVLYHQKIQNDSEVLSRFHRALKPGGILILNLPAYNF